jgi:hypothetical protein
MYDSGLAQPETRPKQPCGMQARLSMALRGPSWRNYTRPETAYRAISTWQKLGMPRQRLTDFPQHRVSLHRCVRIALLPQHPFSRNQH